MLTATIKIHTKSCDCIFVSLGMNFTRQTQYTNHALSTYKIKSTYRKSLSQSVPKGSGTPKLSCKQGNVATILNE
jgi:hypothetical protein